MSWKLYLIIISNAADTNPAEVPAKIGFKNLKPHDKINLSEAQRSEILSIGKHNGNIIIVSYQLVFQFYTQPPSDFEKKLIESFPNSEIAALTYNGTVDLYGYNIINNGERQRVKHGADLSIYIDEGEKLPEEIEISKGQLFDKEELEDMKQRLTKNELQEFIDEEISIRTTFRLTSRYFGKELDQMENLEEIMLTQYH